MSSSMPIWLNVRQFVLLVMLSIVSLTMVSAPHAQEHDHSHTDEHSAQQSPVTGDKTDADEVVYVCPMHTHIVRDEEGTCPICGMDLEPRRQATASSDDSQTGVTVDGKRQQNFGIQVAEVTTETLWRYLPTQGRVTWNEQALNHIHPRASGWVELLAVRSEGERVAKGDKLYELYSQELVVAQQDHLQTLDSLTNLSSSERRGALQRDGRTRLRLLGFTDEQVSELEKNREVLYQVPIYARHSGIVTQLNVAEGMYVEPGTVVMTLAGTNALWLIADVPERQADWFDAESTVAVTLPQAGIEDLETTIDYIYPELDETSRNLRVRIQLPELAAAARQKLLVGQQASVDLYGGPKRDTKTIPLAALLTTGARNQVILRLDGTNFVQREVHVGLIVDDRAEILHGLEVGDEVVVSGQFLLDADANLAGNGLNLSNDSATDHQH